MTDRPSQGDPYPRMSGALVLEHRRILIELAGPGRFEKVLTRLAPDVRREYDEISALSWPRVSTAEAIVYATAAELGRDPIELHEQIARAGVERTLNGLWRLLLRFTTDEALVARTPRIYARALNRGELRPRVIGPGRAEIEVHDWPDIPEFSLRGLRVAIETVLRLAGREDVQVIAERSARGPVFRAAWRI
jgi:hypothetical protein